MPQRTNPFQELVTLIERAFASDGDKITPSAMVKVQGQETEREIDILKETKAGLYTIKVAVEAKDETRPMELPTFEGYLAKYRGEGRVAVDKFVVVSRNGFTKGVIERAKLADVPLLTLDEAKETDWSKFGPQYVKPGKGGSAHVTLAPHLHDIEVFPSPGEGLGLVAAKEGRVVCLCHGRDLGSPFEIAHNAMNKRLFPHELLEKLEKAALDSPTGSAMGRIDWPFANGQLRFRGKDFPLEKMVINMHCTNAKGAIDCKLYEITDAVGQKRMVQHFSATAGNTIIEWLMPEGLHSKKVALQMKKSPKARAEERKKERHKNRRRNKKT